MSLPVPGAGASAKLVVPGPKRSLGIQNEMEVRVETTF